MAEEKLPPSKLPDSWFNTGFPVLEGATSKQKKYIIRLWEDVAKMIDQSELCMIELMGRNEWVDALSKKRASDLISGAKYVKDNRNLKNDLGGLTGFSKGVCTCGRKMEETGWGFKCQICGKEVLSV